MLFLDNAAPDSCCAERPLHIPTSPRLVSRAATRKRGNRDTDRPTDRPTDYNNPSLRMRAGVKEKYKTLGVVNAAQYFANVIEMNCLVAEYRIPSLSGRVA